MNQMEFIVKHPEIYNYTNNIELHFGNTQLATSGFFLQHASQHKQLGPRSTVHRH